MRCVSACCVCVSVQMARCRLQELTSPQCQLVPLVQLFTGPISSFLVISDPAAAKHVLRGTDNPQGNKYDKGLVAEVRHSSVIFNSIQTFFTTALLFFHQLCYRLSSMLSFIVLVIVNATQQVSQFLFGDGFAVAGGERWRARRRAVGPSLHRCGTAGTEQLLVLSGCEGGVYNTISALVHELLPSYKNKTAITALCVECL
jgi:cytochrome P450